MREPGSSILLADPFMAAGDPVEVPWPVAREGEVLEYIAIRWSDAEPPRWWNRWWWWFPPPSGRLRLAWQMHLNEIELLSSIEQPPAGTSR